MPVDQTAKGLRIAGRHPRQQGRFCLSLFRLGPQDRALFALAR
jgi:hypothetical protein